MIKNPNANFLLNQLLRSIALGIGLSSQCARADERAVDFETTSVGKPLPSWTENGVTFELAHAPKKTKAIGRIMFFPHLGTGRKGILNAMANEAIPIRAKFANSVDKVTLTLWGSTTSSAMIEAFDADGNLVDQESVKQVPVRRSPEEQVPFFELIVEAKGIAYLHISGAQPGGYLALDELRW